MTTPAPLGTYSDKYRSRSLVARTAVAGFDRAVDEALRTVPPVARVLEPGCGEGHVSALIARAQPGAVIHGLDLSADLVAEATAACPAGRFVGSTRSLYDLTPADAAPLVVCCEVLEHLEAPEAGLDALARAATGHLVLSVPREPLWRTLNVLRGAYWPTLGNTPGHLQHWSKRAFVRFVARRFDVLRVWSPVPWTVVLARKR
jgi:2-polyprenyl-3-methyl-5-hydroxy-6-metoxy-1,4-benzoquinol methylase